MSKIRYVVPFALVGSFAFGCSTEEGGQKDEDIVNVAHTTVKDQSIGNCWVYATTSWAESLHLSYAGEALDLSESWLTYMDWYLGILAGELEDDGAVQTGGWFGEAQDLVARFGYFDEARFIPGEENSEESRRQATALAAINTSLKSGVLSDPAKRRDRAVVRAELDRAWQLNDDVVALIDETFGRTFTRDFLRGGATVPEASTGLRAPASIAVGYDTNAEQEVTLADAVGRATYSSSTDSWSRTYRTGTYVWRQESYPSNANSRRTFLQRMQRELHKRRPVVISWFVDFAAMQGSDFFKPPTTPGRQGGHMTVLQDYQINDVPGFGSLKAGVEVTDGEALEAALAPSAKIEFLRVKNSWGTGYKNLDNDVVEDLRGYHDLYMEYLNADLQTCDSRDDQGRCQGGTRRAFTGLSFPSAAWNNVGPKPAPPVEPGEPGENCAHGFCSAGDKLDPTCDPCAQTVCDVDSYCCHTAWDGICVNEARELCSLTCE